MEAKHLFICKFESPVSPNYMILQRSFLATIEDIEGDGIPTSMQVYGPSRRQQQESFNEGTNIGLR